MHLTLVASNSKRDKKLTITKLMPKLFCIIDQKGGGKVYRDKKMVKAYLFDFNGIKHLKKLYGAEREKAMDMYLSLIRSSKPKKKKATLEQVLPV